MKTGAPNFTLTKQGEAHFRNLIRAKANLNTIRIGLLLFWALFIGATFVLDSRQMLRPLINQYGTPFVIVILVTHVGLVRVILRLNERIGALGLAIQREIKSAGQNEASSLEEASLLGTKDLNIPSSTSTIAQNTIEIRATPRQKRIAFLSGQMLAGFIIAVYFGVAHYFGWSALLESPAP